MVGLVVVQSLFIPFLFVCCILIWTTWFFFLRYGIWVGVFASFLFIMGALGLGWEWFGHFSGFLLSGNFSWDLFHFTGGWCY